MNKKASNQEISEVNIRAVYQQGDDAVVDLVTNLIARIEKRHRARIAITVVNHLQAIALGRRPKAHVKVAVKKVMLVAPCNGVRPPMLSSNRWVNKAKNKVY